MHKLMRDRKRRCRANCPCGKGSRCGITAGIQKIPATRAMDKVDENVEINAGLKERTFPDWID